jgi:hypothetical protein
MSSAFYPLGMKKYNNHVHQGGYKTWKGKGIFRNPVGITSTHIRPLTNLDPGNQFPTGFGLPRPLKHYRKGSLPPNPDVIEVAQTQPLVAYNLDRHVKSSMGTSLGGSRLGGGLISAMIDTPGAYSIKNNTPTDGIVQDCNTCKGIAVISDWQPVTSLTEKPQPNVENKEFCCNEERKAIQMTLPNSTMVSKKYYQTTYAKLYNRCKTFQQNQFAYLSGAGNPALLQALTSNPQYTAILIKWIKPGSPLALQLDYLYSAQCNPNYVVESAGEIAFTSLISNYLFSAGKITEGQLQSLAGLSINDFITTLLQIVSPTTFNTIVEYIYQTSAILTADEKKCKKTVFKPNNYKYSKQGAVSSSNRILQLNVETINKNLSQIKKGLNIKRNVCRDRCYHPYYSV